MSCTLQLAIGCPQFAVKLTTTQVYIAGILIYLPIHCTLSALVSGSHTPLLPHVATEGPLKIYDCSDGHLKVTFVPSGTLGPTIPSIITLLPVDGLPQLTV